MFSGKRKPYMVNYRNFISIDPEIRFGKPCLNGTRIAVGDVLGWLGAGMSETEIIEDFPELTHEQIMACLLFAADRERNVKIVISA